MELFNRIRRFFLNDEEDETDRGVGDPRTAGRHGDEHAPGEPRFTPNQRPAWGDPGGSRRNDSSHFRGAAPMDRYAPRPTPFLGSPTKSDAPRSGLFDSPSTGDDAFRGAGFLGAPAGDAGDGPLSGRDAAGDRDNRLTGSTLLGGGDDADTNKHPLF